MALSRDSFADLATRVATGAILAVVGLAAVWLGHPWFTLMVVAVVGVLLWELARMQGAAPRLAASLGILAAAALLTAKFTPPVLALALLMVPALAGYAMMRTHKVLFAVLAALILLAGFGLLFHRDAFGFTWMLWLVLLVAVTDIAGYFAGRIMGGPKFWPAVSPKKTWSGTVAGWIGAAVVGAAFMLATPAGVELIVISILLSMASQAGDVAESAVKRSVGVKDSSNLLPGHGGVWDRFDGLLGAALLLLMIEMTTTFPPTAG